MKIIIGDRVAHVNEYHFIHLLREVRGAVPSGTHDVVISLFTDFNGLGEAAAKVKFPQTFPYANITWGWNGDKELYPVADDKNIVKLGSDFISELSRIAKDPDQKPSQGLRADKFANQAYTELTKYIGGKSSSTSGTEESEPGMKVSFWLDSKNLPGGVLYRGGKPSQGFAWAMDGGPEGWHLHLFFEEKGAPSEERTRALVESVTLSTTAKNHCSPDGGRIKWQKDPGRRDLEEFEKMKAVMETLSRHSTTTSGDSKDREPEERKKKPTGYLEERDAENDEKLKLFARGAGLTVDALRDFLEADAPPSIFDNYTEFSYHYGDQIAEEQARTPAAAAASPSTGSGKKEKKGKGKK